MRKTVLLLIAILSFSILTPISLADWKESEEPCYFTATPVGEECDPTERAKICEINSTGARVCSFVYEDELPEELLPSQTETLEEFQNQEQNQSPEVKGVLLTTGELTEKLNEIDAYDSTSVNDRRIVSELKNYYQGKIENKEEKLEKKNKRIDRLQINTSDRKEKIWELEDELRDKEERIENLTERNQELKKGPVDHLANFLGIK